MSWKKIFYPILGYVHVPDKILKSKEKKLLHISDTPTSFYNPLRKLIKELQPEYIVHTGDLVDNIKLQFYPALLKEYAESIKVLTEILEDNDAKKIVVALGNHDHKDTLLQFSSRIEMIHRVSTLEIENLSFCISHYSKEVLKNPADFNLFGHDLDLKNDVLEDKIFLNGISYINIIGLETKKIYCLSYPWGTNDMRLSRRRLRLT